MASKIDLPHPDRPFGAAPVLRNSPKLPLETNMQVGHMDEPEPIEIPPFLTPYPMDAVPESLLDLVQENEAYSDTKTRLWSLYLELNGKLMLNLASPEEIALHSRLHNELHWIAPPIEGEA